ncbi:MAG TPA: DUF5666 domain-containing protein [Abditibacteriaceae bacterium]|jgi:hypothetical protein
MNTKYSDHMTNGVLPGVLAAATLFVGAASAQQRQAGELQNTGATQKVTVTGLVTQAPQGRQFTLRTANGRTYRVDTQGSAASLPRRGERVNAFGVWRKGILQAANIRPVSTPSAQAVVAGAGRASALQGRQMRTVGGVLTNYPDQNRFELRAEEGRTYQVHSVTSLPVGLSAGDRVRAHGTWNNGVLQARSIRMLAEGGLEELRNAARTVVGLVVSDDLGAEFQVRTDNGTIYRVSEANTSRAPYRIGDRVSALGGWRNGILQATSIRVLSND